MAHGRRAKETHGSPALRLQPVPRRERRFDQDSAREAWRHYARANGSRAYGTVLRSRRWKPIPWVGFAVIACIALWMGWGDVAAVPTVLAVSDGQITPVRQLRSVVIATPPRRTEATRLRVGPEIVVGDARPSISPKRLRQLARLPRVPSDRGPLGGVGPEALHVDRVAFGPSHKRGRCANPKTAFSREEHRVVNVCFRAVHRRVAQYVVVRWEHGGQTLRRHLVRIPAVHSYRTRAGFRLSRARVGQWTVYLESRDGVELGRRSFLVEP